jgi:hypothetical protein
MGRWGARRIGFCVALLCALFLPTSCLERPSQADKDAVRTLITQYLQDRANRLTQAGASLAGRPLTSVRLSKKFAARVAGDAGRLDARRRATKHQHAWAEVVVTLEDLDYDGDTATAKVHDQTTLHRAPPGDRAGPDATRFATDREFTLDREGHGWALSGHRVLGPDLEQKLPETDFPQ